MNSQRFMAILVPPFALAHEEKIGRLPLLSFRFKYNGQYRKTQPQANYLPYSPDKRVNTFGAAKTVNSTGLKTQKQLVNSNNINQKIVVLAGTH